MALVHDHRGGLLAAFHYVTYYNAETVAALAAEEEYRLAVGEVRSIRAAQPIPPVKQNS